MSEDVFCKLKDLHHDVRARIEATADWKALQAVERAMGDVHALLPVAAVAAEVPAAVADATPVEDVAGEPAAVAADAEAPAEVEAEATQDAEVSVEAEAAPVVEAAEALPDEAVEAAPAAEEVTEYPTVEAAPEAEAVVAPEIPAEHQALVEEIVSTGAAAAGTGGVATV